MNEKRVLIMGARPYDFPDESGKQVKGTKLHVIDFEADDDDEYSGFMPSSLNVPLEAYPQFAGKLPAYYNVSFTISLAAKKPVLKPVRFDFVQPCSLSIVS